MNKDRMMALLEMAQGVKALRERFEELAHGSADAQDVFRENGRFQSVLIQYQNLFTEELFDEFGVEAI